jgi:hypothetical protein
LNVKATMNARRETSTSEVLVSCRWGQIFRPFLARALSGRGWRATGSATRRPIPSHRDESGRQRVIAGRRCRVLNFRGKGLVDLDTGQCGLREAPANGFELVMAGPGDERDDQRKARLIGGHKISDLGDQSGPTIGVLLKQLRRICAKIGSRLRRKLLL